MKDYLKNFDPDSDWVIVYRHRKTGKLAPEGYPDNFIFAPVDPYEATMEDKSMGIPLIKYPFTDLDGFKWGGVDWSSEIFALICLLFFIGAIIYAAFG